MIINGIINTTQGKIPCEIRTTMKTVEFFYDNRLRTCNLQSIHEFDWFTSFTCNSIVEE